MNRKQALDWCVEHVTEWPNFKPSIHPDGWFWTLCNTNEMILVSDEFRTEYIDKLEWRVYKFRPTVKVTMIPNAESLKYLRQQMYANHYPDHLASSDVSFGQLMKDLNR